VRASAQEGELWLSYTQRPDLLYTVVMVNNWKDEGSKPPPV
jgi:hypothetical protein